ncbi:MAG: hypothetical protein J6M05_03760 [Cardiobacteriaceae bacterium]|nr:hypothetical protein [Cardiobacteriaceae bacterium]
MSVKNICLIGFSHDTEEKIKKLFVDYLEPDSVQFVYANEKKRLDGAVVNAALLDAPQIQKYVQTVRYPIVCVCQNKESERKSQRYRLQAISSIDPSSSLVRVWLSKLLGGEELLKKDRAAAAGRVAAQRQSLPTLSSEVVLRSIKQNANKIFRGQNGDHITWVCPAQDVVFINYARDSILGYEKWEWCEVPEEDIPFYARKLKKDLWLFETLWHSNIDGNLYINDNANFRLLHWPQPMSRLGRTEALKLAACAQATSVSVQAFQQKTGYSTELINRFLLATTMAGQIEEVLDGVPVKITRQQQLRQEHRISDGQQKKEKLSLLQRLRAKLGI